MCLFGKIAADLVFDGRHQKTVDAIIDRFDDHIFQVGLLVFQISFMSQLFDMVQVIGHGDRNDLFLFCSVDRHNAVIGNIGDLLGEFIVHLIDLLFIDRILL